MPAVSTLSFYDPDQVVILAAGGIMGAYADGEFCTIEMVSDAFSDVVGTDGAVARAKSNDRRATVTLKLLQTSPANEILAAAHRGDLNSPNGAGVFVFQLDDLQGGKIYHGAQAWVVKAPSASFDRTVKSWDWEIRVAYMDRFDGGNAF